MKRLPLLILFLAGAAQAADLSTSQNFSDGDTINAAKLNNIIGQAAILPGSIGDRSVATPISTDYVNFLQGSSGLIKKTTVANLQGSLSTSPTFTGTTTISQETIISGILSPSQITADQNDYAPTNLGTSTTIRLSTDATRNITGITGGADGRILIIHNVGSFNIVLKHANSSSSAANRFTFQNAVDDVILPDGVRVLHYDNTTARWRKVSGGVTPNPTFVTLTDGATVIITCSPEKVSQNATVTLGGNRALAMSGIAAGMQGILIVKQDGTGSRTLTLPAGSKAGSGGAGAVTLSTAASAIDILSWTYDGTNYFWLINKNFTSIDWDWGTKNIIQLPVYTHWDELPLAA